MTNMLESHAKEYLQLRRTLGHKLARHDGHLHSFLAYLDASGHRTISVEIALEWACLPATADPRWEAARLSGVRGSAAYVHTREPALASIIPAGLIPTRVIRQQPYIYSADQTRALMETALTLQPPLRGLTLQTVIGLWQGSRSPHASDARFIRDPLPPPIKKERGPRCLL